MMNKKDYGVYFGKNFRDIVPPVKNLIMSYSLTNREII